VATIVARRDGRFEIRESFRTPGGPRSRTLAAFRVMTEEVLDGAARRARSRLDRSALVRRARDLGAQYEESHEDRAALDVLSRLSHGGKLAPSVAGALRDALRGSPAGVTDSIPPVLEWLGRGAAERGEALRDLLRLADRVARSRGLRPAGDLAYPHIRSRSLPEAS